jgi:hypothetical protein
MGHCAWAAAMSATEAGNGAFSDGKLIDDMTEARNIVEWRIPLSGRKNAYNELTRSEKHLLAFISSVII